MWAVLGPARPEEGTTCFRAGLGLYFYSLGWHGTARNFFGPSRPDPFWPEARWAWAVPARPGPIPSTSLDGVHSSVLALLPLHCSPPTNPSTMASESELGN